MYIELGKYSFNFKQTFSNPIFSILQSKTLENLSKKLIKLNKITIQNKIKDCNSFPLKKKKPRVQLQRGKVEKFFLKKEVLC